MTINNNNENENNLILVAIILALFFAIVLTSCGSRKVQKSETKETEKTEIKTEVKTETKLTDNTKIVDTSTSDEIEIIPVDNTLPITVNGKKYTNSRIKWKKTKNNISIAKDVKVQHNAQKSYLKTDKRDLIIERKVIDRKQSYWWLLWFLLLIPAYYLWRKYKGYFI
jgi:hypothetical protein